MKKWIVKGIVLSLFMGANAQALTRSQHDTAVGAILGGVAGAVVCGGDHQNHHIHNAQGGSLRNDGDVLFHAQHDVFFLLYAHSIGYPLHHRVPRQPWLM